MAAEQHCCCSWEALIAFLPDCIRSGSGLGTETGTWVAACLGSEGILGLSNDLIHQGASQIAPYPLYSALLLTVHFIGYRVSFGTQTKGSGRVGEHAALTHI